MRIDVKNNPPRDRSRTMRAKSATMSRKNARRAKAFAFALAWN